MNIYATLGVTNAKLTPNDRSTSFNVDGRLAMANSTITLNYGTEFAGRATIFQMFDLNMKNDFAFWNVSVVCQDRAAFWHCSIICNENNSRQFITFDESCGNITSECSNNCEFIESIDDIDSDTITIVNEITDLVNHYKSLYEYECGDGSNNSVYFDIGYPLYGESFIINDKYQRYKLYIMLFCWCCVVACVIFLWISFVEQFSASQFARRNYDSVWCLYFFLFFCCGLCCV